MARGDSPWFRTRNARRDARPAPARNTGISRRHGTSWPTGSPLRACHESRQRGRRALQVAQDQFGERGMRLRRRRLISASAQPDQAGHGQRRQREAPWRAPAQDRRPRHRPRRPPARSGRSSRRRAGPAWTAVPADRRRGTARDSPAVRRASPRAAHSTRYCGRWRLRRRMCRSDAPQARQQRAGQQAERGRQQQHAGVQSERPGGRDGSRAS